MIAEITTSPLLEVQSIVISVSVCLFVCLSAHICPCYPVAVTPFSADGNAIHYVFLVL